MEEIKITILKLGEQNKINALQEYISTVDTENLTCCLQEYHYQAGIIWKHLLKSFDENSNSHNKRFEITMFVLKLIEENKVSNTVCNEIIHILRIELPKYKPNHLIDICNLCVKQIQEGNALHTSWKDLLPEVLSILVEKNCIMHNNIQISGVEFKSQIINSLCVINWATDIVTPLAVMFRDISLTKEEHLQVVNKLCLCMEHLNCQELPAFTHQLLKLCSKQNSGIICLKLQHYFTYKIYKNLGRDLDPSSDSSDFDEITNSSEHDAIQEESTVLYYIQESATLGNDCIKEYINSLKHMTKAPEFVLHPFQLTVLLTISSVKMFKEQSIEIIRSCIVRVITEDIKKNETAWFRNIISSSSRTSNIISVILENSIKERPYVAQGLINLSFVLLSAGSVLGMKNIAEAQWQLGTFILLKLMKKKEEVSTTVITQLCNRIVVGENVPQLTECLYQMCRNILLIMIDNQGIIIRITDEILQLPGWSSKCIIDAILPLIRVSYRIRDNLILMLKKALYSRELEIRKMAVNGYLKLLKCLRISNLVSLSQSTSTSNYSFLTQITLENHVQKPTNEFSNEAICLEVLGILRRCFMQQAEVREELYNGQYDAVCTNMELGIPILKMLKNHFDQFRAHDENTLPPLNFSEIVNKKNNEVILQEPLGHLIYVMGLILTKIKESHDPSDLFIMRITNSLDTLCVQMAQCELIHFELDSGRDLLSDLPECQTDMHILKQALSVYEALMGYLIVSWSPESENMSSKIYSLFQAYGRLIDLSKNLKKTKKGDGKRSKDETKSKNPTKIFKPHPTVLDFRSASKILNILHEPTITSTSIRESNILKVKYDFHRYVLSVILQLFQNVKSSKCIETMHTKPYFNYCAEIAKILYERIIERLMYVVDFDVTTAALGVECFHVILNVVVTYYKEKFINFLAVVGKKSKDADLGDHLLPFIEILQRFFQKDDDDFGTDTESKRIPAALVNVYLIFVNNLPHDGPQITQVLGWLKKITNESAISNKNVGNALIVICLNLHIRCKEETNLYENVANKLCDVIGTIDNDKPECSVQLKIINESTALSALSSLANTLKMMLNEADWIIQRCRAEYNLTMYPGVDKVERRKEILKTKERDLCCHICRIVNVCTLISNMTVPSGSSAETVFKILLQMYSTLNSLTKYFLLISSKINPAFQSARFERVIKLSGKPLSNRVYSFILYIEKESDPDDESTQYKKKSLNPNTMKTKILRETRLIPKLVYEMEQFGRNVITLSNKTKIDLTKYVGLGTSRDFRIQAPILKEALEDLQKNLDESRTTNNEDETNIPRDGEANTSSDGEEQDNSSPPEKKKRE